MHVFFVIPEFFSNEFILLNVIIFMNGFANFILFHTKFLQCPCSDFIRVIELNMVISNRVKEHLAIESAGCSFWDLIDCHRFTVEIFQCEGVEMILNFLVRICLNYLGYELGLLFSAEII